MITTFFDLIHSTSNSTTRHSQRRVRFHTCPKVDHIFARAPCVSTSCRILTPGSQNSGDSLCQPWNRRCIEATSSFCPRTFRWSLSRFALQLSSQVAVSQKRGFHSDQLVRGPITFRSTDECVSQCFCLSSAPCSRDSDVHFAMS